MINFPSSPTDGQTFVSGISTYVWSAANTRWQNNLTNRGFIENDQVITESCTISAGKNAVSGGPITIATGVVVTIPTDATWTIV